MLAAGGGLCLAGVILARQRGAHTPADGHDHARPAEAGVVHRRWGQAPRRSDQAPGAAGPGDRTRIQPTVILRKQWLARH